MYFRENSLKAYYFQLNKNVPEFIQAHENSYKADNINDLKHQKTFCRKCPHTEKLANIQACRVE